MIQNRTALLVAAAAVFALLVVPIATAGGDREATASGKVNKKIKKLKRQVNDLQAQIDALQPGQQGPAGPKGDKGDPGEDGLSSGPAGGGLTGNYPNPSIANGAITNPKLGAAAVTGSKVAPNALGASHIDESSLDYGGAGCKLGLIHSFARIKGSASMPSSFTTSPDHIDFVHNCSGGTTEVRRNGVGNYWVRFNGDPAALAIATANIDGGCTQSLDHIITVRYSAGEFQVASKDPNVAVEDGCVTIMTF